MYVHIGPIYNGIWIIYLQIYVHHINDVTNNGNRKQ